MNVTNDPRCDRCGYPLKTIIVQVPIWSDWTAIDEPNVQRVLVGYEEREDVCECERCHGAY